MSDATHPMSRRCGGSPPHPSADTEAMRKRLMDHLVVSTPSLLRLLDELEMRIADSRRWRGDSDLEVVLLIEVRTRLIESLSEAADSDRWVTPTVAAAMVGYSADTVRYWISKKYVEYRELASGGYQVERSSLFDQARKRASKSRKVA